MSNPFQPQTVEDFLSAFDAGMNSGVSPLLLPKNQLAFGTNTTVRGAYATHRPPFTLQTLVFNSPITQAMFVGGLWQGAGYYQPDVGIQQLLASISGHLYLLTPTASTWTVADVSIPGDLDDPLATQVWMFQAEKWMIVTDGTTTLPLFFDGTSSRRSIGNLLPYLTMVSGGATVPAAPGTLTVTLALAPVKQWAAGTPVNGLLIGDYVVVNWTGPATVVLQKTNDQDGPPPGTPINYTLNPYIYPELPAGRVGAYGMGRVALSLTDGKQFVIGDITGGPSGSVTNSYRDAVLKVNENSYLLNGGYFSVPGAWGDIRAMIIASTLDASLGQGPLQIMTPTHCFSCALQVDRTVWATVKNPILTVSLISNGSESQNATVNANGDILLRAVDGIRSLLLGRRDFDTWGNVVQSTEMNRVLSLDTEDLLIYSSAIVFDNRMLMTAGPSAVPGHGVFHPGLIALNFDPVSSLRGKAPSVYDGLWTGINTLQLVVGRFSETERGFSFTYNLATSQIELYEIGTTPVDVFSTVEWPTAAEIYDNGVTPIIWTIESPVIFNSGPNAKRQFIRMLDGEIVIDNLVGTVNFAVFYKPDQYPCWTHWFSWAECAAKNTDISKPQFRPRMGLGEPASQACDPSTNRPMREGFNFQVKLVIQGHCRVLGQNFKAVTLPLSTYAKQSCTPICQPIVPVPPPKNCIWHAADGNLANGPSDYVAYIGYAAAFAATASFTAPDLVWGSVAARWNQDGSAAYVDIRYTPSGVHTGWNWYIGLVGSNIADSGVGSLPSARAALTGAQHSTFLPAGFCAPPPPPAFSYTPPNNVIAWTDSGGIHFVPDLATFITTANFPTVTQIAIESEGITSISGLLNFPMLNTVTLNLNALPSYVINQILVDLVTLGNTGGSVDVSGQTPAAPPTVGPPNGITAKAALLAEAPPWMVTTD